MIHPDHKLKQLWSGLVLCLTIFASVEIPARLALGYELTGAWKALDILVTICFCLDIVINFFTAEYRGGQLIASPRRIARRYLGGWFIIDFLAAFPFELFLVGPLGTLTGAARILRLLRLFRLARLSQFLQRRRTQSEGIISLPMLRMLILGIWVLLIAHWTACFWIVLDGVNLQEFDGDPTPISIYIQALYWAITTITTIGYGDITPTGDVQTVFTMLVQLIGAATYGYVIGNIASLLANIDVGRARYLEKMEKVAAFMRFKKIPRDLQEQIRNYYTYLWESRRGYDEIDVLHDLPAPLEMKVAVYLNHDIIEKVPLFEGASSELVRHICLGLHPEVHTPGDYIFREGEPGSKMYFISRGAVEVVSSDGDQVFATLREGDFFGEIALLHSQPRNASIRSVDYCDLYSLEKDRFRRILLDFPEFAVHIREVVRRREENRRRPAETAEGAGSVRLPPLPVENLRVEADAAGNYLSWDESEHAAVYQVLRLDSKFQRWINVNGYVESTSYRDPKAARAGDCLYRVRAINETGKGAWSDTVRV